MLRLQVCRRCRLYLPPLLPLLLLLLLLLLPLLPLLLLDTHTRACFFQSAHSIWNCTMSACSQ